MVGWMHYLGRGVERDQQKGVKIIRENESDEFLLGELDCRTEEDFQYCDSLAARKFFKLCRLGSKQDWLCRHLMAVCLIHSFGVTQNHDKAARIFEQLANENHSDSQYWLGQCHYGSWGKPRNYSKAFEWFSKSADQGNPYGQWMVGHSYYHHGGVSRDLAKAVEWYRKAAEQGHRQAQYDLGFCYGNGYGVARDWELSTYWSRKSFAQHR
ncbi:uncharacterized protein BJ171DRAFT_485694 [Polychytrium aggregatum]|uniref:uncharacterized protein n=1 Tax=Polychytrium aggregatum TaxID=110093 RepID=UPI0022FF0566|nr:uncharacterized protein BJ171DRAFT_485694 [Polychytrium aggregatum]KAI9209187.1 hypothetical protein BJ171DRAFT_485694 [Polychytrium aggregatum]